MEKRAFERIPSNVDVKFYCSDRCYRGTVTDISENGMFISTKEMYLPFESRMNVCIPFRKEVFEVTVDFCRIIISPLFYTCIGLEIHNPPGEYMEFLESQRSVCSS
jgi:hypothetical protein